MSKKSTKEVKNKLPKESKSIVTKDECDNGKSKKTSSKEEYQQMHMSFESFNISNHEPQQSVEKKPQERKKPTCENEKVKISTPVKSTEQSTYAEKVSKRKFSPSIQEPSSKRPMVMNNHNNSTIILDDSIMSVNNKYDDNSVIILSDNEKSMTIPNNKPFSFDINKLLINFVSDKNQTRFPFPIQLTDSNQSTNKTNNNTKTQVNVSEPQTSAAKPIINDSSADNKPLSNQAKITEIQNSTNKQNVDSALLKTTNQSASTGSKVEESVNNKSFNSFVPPLPIEDINKKLNAALNPTMNRQNEYNRNNNDYYNNNRHTNNNNNNRNRNRNNQRNKQRYNNRQGQNTYYNNNHNHNYNTNTNHNQNYNNNFNSNRNGNNKPYQNDYGYKSYGKENCLNVPFDHEKYADNRNRSNSADSRQDQVPKQSNDLRFIVIDGSNVAREHGKRYGNKIYSIEGIKIVIDYFLRRGHKQIKAIVPRFRRGNSDNDCPTRKPELLDELEEKGFITYTPSRFIQNQLICAYDDRFILKTALHFDAVIVSNDLYRDLMAEDYQFKHLVENNLLQYSFVEDLFLIADDPMGRRGPSIDVFLSNKSSNKQQSNYGNKFNSSKQSTPYQAKNTSSPHFQHSPRSHSYNNFSRSPYQNKTHGQSPRSNFNQPFNTNTNFNNANSKIVKNLMSSNEFAEGKKANEKSSRSEKQSNELFSTLAKMFPNVTFSIKHLLVKHDSEKDVNFFIKQLNENRSILNTITNK